MRIKQLNYIILFLILIAKLKLYSQSNSDLIGDWEIVNIINNTSSSLGNCIEESIGYTQSFYKDSTYFFDQEPGHDISGKWYIVGNEIRYYNSTCGSDSIPYGNGFYAFEITADTTLIISEFMCSEAGGKTYYKKKK